MKSITLAIFILACGILQAQDSSNYKNKFGIGIMPKVKYNFYYPRYGGYQEINIDRAIPYFTYRRIIKEKHLIKTNIGASYRKFVSIDDIQVKVDDVSQFIYDARIGYERWCSISKVLDIYFGAEAFVNKFDEKRDIQLRQWGTNSYDSSSSTTVYDVKGGSLLIGTAINLTNRLSLLIEHNVEFSINNLNLNSKNQFEETKFRENQFKSVTVTYNF